MDDKKQSVNGHTCTQIGAIATLTSNVENLVKTVFGKDYSGGINRTVAEINSNLKLFVTNTEALTTSVSALVKFHTEFEAKEKERLKYKAELEKERAEKEKVKSSSRTQSIALLGVIVTLILALLFGN